jgi:hypothetical protein
MVLYFDNMSILCLKIFLEKQILNHKSSQWSNNLGNKRANEKPWITNTGWEI